MESLFNPSDREALSRRLATLEPDTTRLWGKMDPAHMLRHCALSLADPLGERSVKQVFLGKLVTPFIRRAVFGDQPFRRNSPTDPAYVVSDPPDFGAERTRLATLIDQVVQRGPAKVEGVVHPLFGRLCGAEWGTLI